jgi:hypothetical protein
MKILCGVCKLVGLIAIIGALNWGAIGFFNVDLVARIFGPMTMASRVVYCIVGVSGLLLLFSYFKVCPACKRKCSEMAGS